MKNILDRIKENSTIIMAVAIVALIGYILLKGNNPISKASGFGVNSSDFEGYWIEKEDSNSVMEITQIDGSRYQVVGGWSGIYTVSGGQLEHDLGRMTYSDANSIHTPIIYYIEKVKDNLYFHEGNQPGAFYTRAEKPKRVIVSEVIEKPIEEVKEEDDTFVITTEMIKTDLLKNYIKDVPCDCAGDGCDSGNEYEVSEDSETARRQELWRDARKAVVERERAKRKLEGETGTSIKTLKQIKNLKIVKTNQTDTFIETIFSVEIDFNDKYGKNFKGNIAHRMKKEYNRWLFDTFTFMDCVKEKSLANEEKQ